MFHCSDGEFKVFSNTHSILHAEHKDWICFLFDHSIVVHVFSVYPTCDDAMEFEFALVEVMCSGFHVYFKR